MRQLMSHVDTNLVTRAELALVPAPEPTATWKPIPHIDLIDTLQETLGENGIGIRGEMFALRRDGSTLFGVLELEYKDTADGQAAMGLRTSNDKSMSIQICAGLEVFVCDNLVFRGDLIALNRKHTSGLDLKSELSTAIRRFQEHFGCLSNEIDGLKTRELTDSEAKILIHDVFVDGIFPLRFMPHVSLLYFHPQIDAWQERTLWTLHNAFTTMAKEMPLTTRLRAIQQLGRAFGMSEQDWTASVGPALIEAA
jgi:Domain of unknown function (DUF932)